MCSCIKLDIFKVWKLKTVASDTANLANYLTNSFLELYPEVRTKIKDWSGNSHRK